VEPVPLPISWTIMVSEHSKILKIHTQYQSTHFFLYLPFMSAKLSFWEIHLPHHPMMGFINDLGSWMDWSL
jgi:hypothetical protein